MSTPFEKHIANSKPFIASGVLINSNQEYYYINEKLENEKIQIEQIIQLETNLERIQGELNEAICNHQDLKDVVNAERLLQDKINQNIKRQMNYKYRGIYVKLNEQAELYQKLLNQVNQHESVHTLFTTELNDLKENSQRLSEQFRQSEMKFSRQLVNKNRTLHNKIKMMVEEQELLRVKQKEYMQDLFDQIKQNESHLSESSKILQNKIQRLIREHQLLKLIVDTYLLLQSNRNQEMEIQINQNESGGDFSSIQEAGEHLKKMEQLVLDDEMMEHPIAFILNILPSNYPAESIFINGKQEQVTAFLSVNNEEKIAHFLDNQTIKQFDFRQIEGITLGDDW